MSRILIIDDEVLLRQALRSMLERAGHTVLDAADGREGMALWRRELTDLVLTDIFMPEMDGVEFIREMKKIAVKSKIIAMSGGGRKGLLGWKPAALLMGADRVLVKPFNQRTFLLTVQEVLGGLPDTNDAVLPSSATARGKSPQFPRPSSGVVQRRRDRSDRNGWRHLPRRGSD